MSGGDYVWHRKVNQDIGGFSAFGATGVSGNVTLVAAQASGAIFIQRASVYVTTGSAQTWQLQDSSGNAVTPSLDMTTAGVPFTYDFGDRGIQLATGASLVVSGSASGAGGRINWEGYRKYMGGTSVGFFPASGASGTTP